MSSANALADAGLRAISAGKYAEGIEKLTQALEKHAAPLWHLGRSKAHLRTNQLDLALYDAEMALRIAYDRGHRHHMAEAQNRRSITFFRMGRFADADVCAFWATRLIDGALSREDDGQQNKVDDNGDYLVRVQEVQDEAKPKAQDGLNTALQANARTKEMYLRNEAFSWRVQALSQMEKLPAGHDGRKPHALVKYPKKSEISKTKATPQHSPAAARASDAVGGETSSTTNAPTVASNREKWEKVWDRYGAMYSQHKIRFSYYQTETSLTVDIFLKNLSPDQVTVESGSRTVKLTPVEGVAFSGLRSSIVLLLFGEIKPEAVKCNVKSMKIELILQKQRAGKWPSIRHENAFITDNLTMNPNTGITFGQFHDLITALGYSNISELELPDFDSDPSAWYATLLEKLRSKLESSLAPETQASNPSGSILPPQPSNVMGIEDSAGKTKPKSAPSYPTSSKKGATNWDTIDDPDEGQATGDVNSFFQEIYEGGNDDAKRAMMKSFIESNGTALSTNWDDAKNKTYQTQPPDGVEAKKWD